MEQKPFATCLYQNAEIQPNQTVRVNNDELKCIQNPEGDLSIIQKHYLHNSCSLGGLNETLGKENNCPGTTKIISHSRYGSGSKVRFSTDKGIILTDNQ
uniref:Uncharacterized protein n=1 Tax=Panagrolaimus superbus TaxID=310955 RepID=A0A914XVK8_9BILA